LLQLTRGGSPAIPAGSDGLAKDFLDGEDITAPAEGDSETIDGSVYVWQRTTDDDGLWSVTAPPGVFTAYWTIALQSLAVKEALLHYRHNGGLKIWAFGAVIVDKASSDNPHEELTVPLHLRNGLTRLLFKLHGGSGDDFFAVRLTDNGGNTLTNVFLQYTGGGLSTEGAIRILSPAEGETYAVGETLPIVWITDFRRVSLGVAPYISLDGGLSFIGLINNAITKDDPEYTADTGTFNWEIPDSIDDGRGMVSTVSNTAVVRVFSQYEPDLPEDISPVFRIVSDSKSVDRFQSLHHAGFTIRQAGGGNALKFEGVDGNGAMVQLLDARGKTIAVLKGLKEGTVVPVGILPAGMYIAVIEEKSRTRTRATLLW